MYFVLFITFLSVHEHVSLGDVYTHKRGFASLRIHIQIPIRNVDTLCFHMTLIRHYPILHTRQLQIQELIQRVEKRILFYCSLLAVFLSQIKSISNRIAFTSIVVDIDRNLLVDCKQNEQRMQCKKNTGSLQVMLVGKTLVINVSALK